MKKNVLFDNRPYMWGWETVETKGRNTVRFTFVETGPAMSVVPLERENEDIFLNLIQEKREPDGVQELKAVGGYNRLGESYEECALRKLREEVGIAALKEDLVDMGRMVGFTVIKLPIRLFYTFRWQKDKGATDFNIKSIRMSLDEAVNKVMRHEFGDESAVLAVLRLYVLKNQGLL